MERMKVERTCVFHGGPLDGQRHPLLYAGKEAHTPDGDRYVVTAVEGNTNGEEIVHYTFLATEEGQS